MTGQDPIKVLVVDDHQLVREGVSMALEGDPGIKVVGEAASAPEAIALITKEQPQVAILDIRLGRGSGFDVVRGTKANNPETNFLILSAYDDHQYVAALLELGISGYLVKSVSSSQLRRAVHDAADGWLVFDSNIAPKVANRLKVMDSLIRDRTAGIGSLTFRETEVLQKVALGFRNAEIALALNIASKTVEAHLESVRLKLNARSRTEAVVIALREGMFASA